MCDPLNSEMNLNTGEVTSLARKIRRRVEFDKKLSIWLR